MAKYILEPSTGKLRKVKAATGGPGTGINDGDYEWVSPAEYKSAPGGAEVVGEYHIDTFARARGSQGTSDSPMSLSNNATSIGTMGYHTWIAMGTVGDTESHAFETSFTIPIGFDKDTHTLKIRVRARYTVVATVANEIDLHVWEPDDTDDLCDTAAQDLTNSYADYDFTITADDLEPGDELIIQVVGINDDTGGGGSAPASQFQRVSAVIE